MALASFLYSACRLEAAQKGPFISSCFLALWLRSCCACYPKCESQKHKPTNIQWHIKYFQVDNESMGKGLIDISTIYPPNKPSVNNLDYSLVSYILIHVEFQKIQIFRKSYSPSQIYLLFAKNTSFGGLTLLSTYCSDRGEKKGLSVQNGLSQICV